MKCPRCSVENSDLATFCEHCGQRLNGGPRGDVSPGGGDATGGIIPYKNPPALIAYYLGLFSIVPLIGLVLGAASVILGIIGLKRKKAAPQVKGQVHAWIGIGCGSVSIVIWVISIGMMIYAWASS